MTLAIDASTPTSPGVANATNTATVTFSPVAQSVIYLFVCGTGPTFTVGAPQAVATIADNVGANLDWTLAVRDNIYSLSGNLGGSAEVWWAYCPSAQTNMTLTVTYAYPNSSSSTTAGIIQPVVFTGAAANQAGAARAIRNATGNAVPSLTLTTTAAGSWVMGIVQNWSNQTAPTVPASQTTTVHTNSTFTPNNTDGDGYWVQMQNSTTANAGTSVTINDTAPSVSAHMAIVEVLADKPMLTTWMTM